VAQWKKIITSGSSADLNQITASVISLGGIGDVSSSIATLSTSITTAGNSPWNISGTDINYTNGNVGIGTSTPGEKLEVEGNISASGVIEANSFTIQGFNFTSVDANTVVYSGSTQFGSGSLPSNTTHQFTGSVLITGSKLELTEGTLSIPGYSDVSASLSSIDLTNVTTNILPSTTTTHNIGSSTKKFNDLFAVNTFFGGVHEINLETEGLDQMQEGTVLSLKDGILQPCEKDSDSLVMGVVSKGRNYPIVLGAEPVLVTGKIKVGDYIITSKIKGHGKGVSPRHIYSKLLFGKVIAQAIEDGEGKSYTIKAMIRKM